MRCSIKLLALGICAFAAVSCQQAFEDSGIPAALGRDAALEAGGLSGPMIPQITSAGQLTRGARHVELAKEFTVELKDGRTWSDILVGVLGESLRVVTSGGGTIVRPWTSMAECGTSYSYGERQGRIKISAFKQSGHILIRLSCYEERP